MEPAAARAHTGIAVLYRRWANKDELVLAAIAHYGHAHPIETPNTGTLRSDLLAVLTAFSNGRATFLAVLAAAGFSGLLVDTGLTPAQARDKLLGDQRIRSDQIIYQRAHDRGERSQPHPTRRPGHAVRLGSPRPVHQPQTTPTETHPLDHRRVVPAPPQELPEPAGDDTLHHQEARIPAN
jgi:AcrR family transcriptional regulator